MLELLNSVLDLGCLFFPMSLQVSVISIQLLLDSPDFSLPLLPMLFATTVLFYFSEEDILPLFLIVSPPLPSAETAGDNFVFINKTSDFLEISPL